MQAATLLRLLKPQNHRFSVAMASESTKQPNVVAGFLRPYICGGSAAMLASCAIHPIDLTKVRLQLIGEGTRTGVRPSAFSVAANVVRTEGISALYAGLSASITRQATYGTTRIGLHSAFSKKMKEMQGGADLTMFQSFISGFASGAIASIVGNPCDVALVRMQSDGLKPAHLKRGYTGVLNAMYRITTEEGIRVLWYGFPPNLMRAIAMNVGMMSSYDQAKQLITKYNGEGLVTNLGSSAVAGFFCAFLSLPFDMLKTRLQNMKIDPKTGEKPYKNVLDCGVKILRKEGLFAFWRGFFTFYARCAPHAMIILMMREQIYKLYDGVFDTSA